MTEEFIQNAMRHGQVGKEWLDAIPTIIKDAEKKWDIQVQPPFKLNYNYVAPARRISGEEAVLKIGFPKDPEFTSEVAALEVFQGQGIEQLLEVDHQHNAILIERVMPGQPVSAIEDDEEATKIMASVMKKLWQTPPKNNTFLTLPEWSKDLFTIRKKYNGTTGSLPEEIVMTAQKLFTHLMDTSQKLVLVHGDLHHDNVLSSDRDGWLAIDPKGVIAEPCYETAAMIRNPYDRLKDIVDLKPLLRKRIEILSEELQFEPQRIQQWGIAQCVLSAVWNADTHKGWQHGVRVAEALNELKF
jgi:streptomycin 6-kinase